MYILYFKLYIKSEIVLLFIPSIRWPWKSVSDCNDLYAYRSSLLRI